MRPILTSVYGPPRFGPSQQHVRAGGHEVGRPGLGDVIATWKDRGRFRWDLARMARDTPELIDDIGLTMAYVETEIAKPFWRR